MERMEKTIRRWRFDVQSIPEKDGEMRILRLFYVTLMKHRSAGWASVLMVFLPGTPAVAASIGFEPPSYSAGSPCSGLSGQAGWYTPPSSANAQVCAYAGVGILPAPGGGTQFAVLHATSDSLSTRAQYNLDFR